MHYQLEPHEGLTTDLTTRDGGDRVFGGMTTLLVANGFTTHGRAPYKRGKRAQQVSPAVQHHLMTTTQQKCPGHTKYTPPKKRPHGDASDGDTSEAASGGTDNG